MKKLLLLVVSVIMTLTLHAQPLLQEGFEGEAFPPANWTVLGTSSPNWSQNASMSASGTSSAFHRYNYSANSAGEGYLITPQLTLTTNSILTFQFAYQYPAYIQNTTFTVEVSTTGAEIGDFTPVMTMVFPENDMEFYEFDVNLSQYVGQSIYIAFHVVDNDGASCYIDDVVVDEAPSCFKPTSIALANATPNSITLSWTGDESAQSYTVEYIPASETSWENAETLSTDADSAVINGLDASTAYKFRINSVCDGSEESAWSNTVTFYTLCSFIPSFPVTWNFDDVENGKLPFCWSRTQVYYPQVNDGELSNESYYGSNAIAVLPPVDIENTPISTLQITFYAKLTSWYGIPTSQIQVGVMTDPADPGTFTLVETLEEVGDEEYTFHEISFAGYEGAGSYIAIKNAVNENTYADDEMYIDNVTLELISGCARPSSLSVTGITTDEAVLNWTGDASTYDIYYKASNAQEYTVLEGIEQSEDGYTIEELTPGTTYSFYVIANCDEGANSQSESYSFNTQCVQVTAGELPYTFGFEGYGNNTVPNCWTRVESYIDDWNNNTYPAVYNNSYYNYSSHSGNGYMVFYPYLSYGHANMIALPSIDEEIHNLRLTLWMKPASNEQNYGKMEFGLISNLNDPSTFEVVKTVVAAELESDGYAKYIIPFEDTDLSGNQNYIAIRCSNQYGYPWYIDDITVERIPECSEPYDLEVRNLTNTSANLTWKAGNGTVVLYTKPASDSVYTSAEAELDENGLYVMENLTSATTYDWYIEVSCSDEDTVYTSVVRSFTTLCDPMTEIPQTWSFETGNTGGTSAAPLPECWRRVSGSYPRVYSDPDVALNGSNILRWGYGNDGMVVLPMVSETYPANTLVLNFFARTQYTTPTQLKIGVMTDVADKNTFTEVSSISPGDSYQEYEIPLSSYNGNGRFIALKYENNDNYLFIDSLTLSQMADCTKPLSLSSSYGFNSATLSWSSSAENFLLYFKESSSAQYSVSEVSLNDDGVLVIDTLQPNTQYSWYVASLCDNDTLNSLTVETFKTVCLPMEADSIPYSIGFENLTWGAVPDCWTVLSSYSGYNGDYPFVTESEYDSHSGYKNFTFYSSEASPNIVALQPIDADIHTLRVSFWLSHYSYNEGSGSFEIGLMSDLSNPQSFEPVKSIMAEDIEDNIYGRYIVSFANTQLEGNSNFIVLRAYGNYETWYMDDLVVENIPDCEEPADVAVTASTTNSVTFTWTGSAESYKFYYKLSTDSVYTSVDAELDEDNTFTLDGLTEGTYYNGYVTSVCASEEESEASNQFGFMTECVLIASLPQTWDFSNPNPGGSISYPLPICWNRITNSSAYNESPYVVTSYEGLNYLYFDLYYKNTYAILPRIDVETLPINQIMLVMNARAEYGEYPNSILEIGVMSNPSDASTFTLVKTVSDFTTENQLFDVSFEDYQGTGSYIAIRTKVQSFERINITEITLANLPDCESVSDLTVSDITSSSANVSWTGESEQGFTVRYKAEDEEEWTTETTSNTSIVFGGLSANTTYTVEVGPTCDGFVIYRTKSFTTLCDIVSEFPYNESFENDLGCWTSELVSGNYDWSSSANTFNSYASAGLYSAYFPYNTGASARLISPQFDLSALSNPTMSYDLYIRPYNGTYDKVEVFYRTDESEGWVSLATHTDNGNASQFATYTLTLPNHTATYQVMFLATGLDAYGSYLDNINIFDTAGGQVEPVEPTVVTNDAEGITQTSATLKGAVTDLGNQDITARGFEWKAVEGGTVAVVNATGNNMSYQLSGLTASTEYTFRAFATTANTTNYGDWKTFTTLAEDQEPCNAPTNLTISDVAAESFVVTWNANGASKWNIRYRVQNNATWTSATVETTPSYAVTGLQPETAYEVQVQAVCENETSEWSVSATATTTTGLSELSKNIILYPNPATNFIDVRVSDNDVTVSRLEVYDVYGKLISEVEVVENPTRINVSTLAGGMYFVKVVTGNGTVTKSFIRK